MICLSGSEPERPVLSEFRLGVGENVRILFVVIGSGNSLGLQVSTLSQLHLDGVDTLIGAVIVACCTAAFEAAVGHRGMALRYGGANLLGDGLDLSCARAAQFGADVKTRQGALKQEWNVRPYRVVIIPDRNAVEVADGILFGLQGRMIAHVERVMTCFDVRIRRRGHPDVVSVKIGELHDPRSVLSRR